MCVCVWRVCVCVCVYVFGWLHGLDMQQLILIYLSYPGCPSERAMVQAHIQKQGFMAVIRVTGLRGLYHGFFSTLYRDISFNMSFFTTRELIVRAYSSWYDPPDPWTRVLLGIPAGCIASVVACPLDVVKTRLQGSELGDYVVPVVERN